jgi:uncharacterized protein (TIGR02246 family)
MSEDERAIRDLVAAWLDATRRGDLNAVLGLMTEDAVFLQPGRPPMLGKTAFAQASRAQAARGQPRIEAHTDIQEMRVLGDWAWMWSRLSVSFTPPGGDTATRSGHTLTIFCRSSGRWLLARDANLLAPP